MKQHLPEYWLKKFSCAVKMAHDGKSLTCKEIQYTYFFPIIYV